MGANVVMATTGHEQGSGRADPEKNGPVGALYEGRMQHPCGLPPAAGESFDASMP